MKWVGIRLAAAGMAVLWAGCWALPDFGPAASATEKPGSAAPAASAPAPTPAATDSTDATLTTSSRLTTLTLWMPEDLYSSSESPGGAVFLQQLGAFDHDHPDIQVTIITKRLRGPGGMLAYLHSAPPVAPGILPDVALLDRDGLAEAARAALIIPLDGLIDPALKSDFYPVAQDLAAVDGSLAGLPYLLEVDHAVYRQSKFSRPPQSFEEVLDSRQFFALPAGASSVAGQIVLLQYVAAGGTLADAQGKPALNVDALTTVLNFYAEAKSHGSFTPALFQIADPSGAWELYQKREANLVALSSTQYLARLGEMAGSRPSAIPTPDGKLYGLARGWSWAIVTRDRDRQQAAMALLRFLIGPANQAAYSQEAHWLPSQAAALSLWDNNVYGEYISFAGQMLTSSHAVPNASTRGAVSVPLRDALEAVVLNDVPPALAAQHAADAVKKGEGQTP